MERIDPFIEATKAKLAGLERELQKDPRWKQAELLREVLKRFAAEGTPAPSDGGSPGETGDEDATHKEIRAFLTHRGFTQKKTILTHLQSKGLMKDADDPKKALGKRLWRMKDAVEGDGKGNYRLKPSKAASGDTAA